MLIPLRFIHFILKKSISLAIVSSGKINRLSNPIIIYNCRSGLIPGENGIMVVFLMKTALYDTKTKIRRLQALFPEEKPQN
jgi:hypothetical protein